MTVTDNSTQLLIVSFFIYWYFSSKNGGSEWYLEYLQFYRRYHCRLPLRKGREKTFIPDFNYWSVFFQSYLLSWCWIERLLFFFFFRDVCLLDTSDSLFWSIFKYWKYSSCTYRDCYDMYVNFMSYIRNDINLKLCCDIKVLFYGFCEYISAFFFCYLNHSEINSADDVRILK